AAQALLYLDSDKVKKSLLESLKKRGPRDRMVHLLLGPLHTKPEEITPLLLGWLEEEDGEIRSAAIEGLRLANTAKDPKLLPRLERLLNDPLAQVRLRVVAAIGTY